jgi:hypothetical protein
LPKKKTKKMKKLEKELRKLDRDLYDNNKYVSREEFLKSKLSKRVKVYYNGLSSESQQKFLKYILKQEDWDETERLSQIERPQEKNDLKITSKKAHSIGELVKDIKNTRKKRKDKNKNVLKTKKGLLVILNPEAYDQTLLDNKDYRKYLKKLADKEREDTSVELDCTLKNFRKELLGNDKVNSAVMDSFWNKHGY